MKQLRRVLGVAVTMLALTGGCGPEDFLEPTDLEEPSEPSENIGVAQEELSYGDYSYVRWYLKWSAARADLVVEDTSGTSAEYTGDWICYYTQAYYGGAYTITRIRNAGLVSAPAFWVYIDNGVFRNYVRVDSIAPGATRDVAYPKCSTYRCPVRITLDAGNEVDETNESNTYNGICVW